MKYMSNRSIKLSVLLIIIGAIFFSSCANRRDLVYFQPDSVHLNSSYELNAPKLQPGDILAIAVTADDVRATIPFNQTSPYQGTSGGMQSSNPFMPTYSIDINGEIDFPKLGRIKLAGMTRTQAMQFLRNEVGKFIVDPGISMDIRNFRVTVLGEVRSPGSFNVSNDRITILEALGMAGDLTINGIRTNVMVVREQNGEKTEYRIDLTKREALNSPVYYLAQNDVIYVEPNGAKVQSSKYTQNNSLFISIASIIITMISVITR
ncbi:polysaccharide biosynthesis/export family protein [Pseudopedobacter sp.]|uniref:polysaccharide biosynthesis/export family protein n=1 Tax=Pseudopedobacter sp. TaxID=1936787 RepID=UPI0033405827